MAAESKITPTGAAAAAAPAAYDVEEYSFDSAAIPNFDEIHVPQVNSLIARLSVLSFVVSTLTDEQLCVLLAEIASLLPYYEAIIDQLLVKRINAEIKIWNRLKNMKNKHTVVFYARYFNHDEISELKGTEKPKCEKIRYFILGHDLGERRHASAALAVNSMKIRAKHKTSADSKKEILSSRIVKGFLKEASNAGNPSSGLILFPYFMRNGETREAMNLILQRILFGECFTFRYLSCLDEITKGKNIIRDKLIDNFISDCIKTISTVEDAQMILEATSSTFIKVEALIESGRMDRFHYVCKEPEDQAAHMVKAGVITWTREQFTDHARCLKMILEEIIRTFGAAEGMKIIIAYSSALNNKVLIAEIDLFLGTYFSSDYLAMDDEKDWEANKIFAVADDTKAYNMVLGAALAGNLSAYEYLTQKYDPIDRRHKFMYNKFRALALHARSNH
ncbi:MAG: hypothetical protein Hyperionvirus29_12 [Hyperionvirus sp.]|uniref:Uncharacterized protein n=1 Tax=Hyperionvirus sp. TaxID=2487770 RepID=A0A3G5AGN6_9VIRU|nr:MAG: hypothetical protein Hyperionvirus29_12 [Hyperionvirus sp.]